MRLRSSARHVVSTSDRGTHSERQFGLRMAKDVERALLQVIAEKSGTGEDGAREYLAALKKEKRYVRDVY